MPDTTALSKYIIAFVAFCMALGQTFAQKEPQYTQYMYNIGSFNPAYVGTVESPEIIGLYRAQWVDIPGAPTTIRGGANIPFSNEKMGLGINIVNDQLGPSTQTFFDIAYSYQIQLSDETKLSFGLNAGGSSLNIDYSKGTFENPSDGSILGGTFNSFYPTVGAGLFMYHEEDWYLGVSVPNFLTNALYNNEVATIVEDNMQVNAIGGYVFELGEQTKFKPAFLVNYLQGSPVTVNLSANFQFIDALTIGASYRIDNAVSGLAGFQISNGMFIGYAYDYNTNSLGEFSGGSHEAILKFYIGRGGFGSGNNKSKNKNSKNKGKQIDSPRFF
ncbi:MULTISPECIES: type IX secretion system membrane protein PorP/SprF [unclassified Allomuricauda]|jgi:type IX secretion system PorP/SprF family membrane protein|uniref:PorP/SprF family type IX secretion system membrane protein n=1 Tax=Flavobacteriaceae TaxID=49546 RepID=UPI001B1DE579|nr:MULTISPECIES: type IX secretion system membrane protein PorP/SprF [unclassified Allomuricauda]MBO6533335.1 type IX secretion system membrane protein PorP/SprF [Allomuricauda sp.]MBO6589851.1 type IX secretion system membrane protein PorP/SprF [Allomuricauda sp.]MBO6619476.1 type IX secretion system membrane protein PorP/SprF [Allomuricauda sp.]MBO6646124.1 type IX secretion system membrane protein PorP/SprF [Allomuricauda sp.]MBO6747761.1 type IX secretion system membrane protein PorP/SprF 